MPLGIPKVVSNLLVNNDPSQRLFNGVVNAINPLLSFVNTTFQTLADGTLQIQRSVAVQGDANVSGKQVITGNSTVGSQNVRGDSSVSGSTVSASGFKSAQDMGIVWASGAVVGTRYQAKRFAQNNEASNTFNAPTLFQPQFSGSIIGLHMYSQGTAGGTFQAQIYKSVTVVSSGTSFIYQTPAQSAGQYFGSGVTFAKGTIPFVSQDYFSLGCTFSAAGNQLVILTLIVEYGA